MSLLGTVAVKLGETLVKSACETITGQKILGDLTGGLSAVLGGRAVEGLDSRRARRQLDEIADTVAERVLNQYGHEFRGLPDGERAVVIEAVGETFELVPPAAGLVLGTDFNADGLERKVRSLTNEYRRTRFFGQDEISLYDLLLRTSCADVVEIVRALSSLANLAVPEIVGRLTEIADEVRKAPHRAIADAAKQGDTAFAEVYRRYVASELDAVDLDSDRLSETSRRYPLSLAYLSLPARIQREPDSPVVTRIESAFASRSRLLLRAQCGGGKTTFLYRLFVLTARRSLTGELARLNSAVPFYVPLHEYAEGELPTPDEFLNAVARDVAGEMPQGWVHRQLRDGESLVLINGVDELPVQRRAGMLDWIKKLTAMFDKPRYVLASRPGAVPEDWPPEVGFEIVDLLPMGPSDARTFIRRWHDAVGSTLSSDVARVEVDACANRLLEALASCHALRALSSNPLTCALMCALHRDNRVDLPGGWLDLIRMVVEILVEERDRERGVADGLALSMEQRIRTLQDLAYWMVTEDLVAPRVEDVQERVGHLLGFTETNGGPTVQTGGVLDHLAVRSGLIHVRPDHTLCFTVPILRDYLAAREAASGSNIRSLLRDSHLLERQHLVVMTAGHAQLARAEELLSGLLVRAAEHADTRDRFYVLAYACLRIAPGLGSELRQRVEACCGLVVPRTAQDAQILATVGPVVVDLLAEQPTDDIEVTLALIHTAAHIGGDDVLPFLAQLAADGRPAVGQALRDASPKFDSEEYGRVVLAGCPSVDELVGSTLHQVEGGGPGE